MSTTFTPLTTGFTWAISTKDASGNPLPTGETDTSFTIGIRADGDTTHSAGNYQYFVTLGAGVTQATLAEVLAAKVPQGGNYWASIDQEDTLNSQTATSGWSPEIAFSIPIQIVTPVPPTGFTVA